MGEADHRKRTATNREKRIAYPDILMAEHLMPDSDHLLLGIR